MPIDKDFSVEDEAYLATVAADPKMTMDEVGADMGERGFVPVTPETATQDPFSAKGSLANALDEAISNDDDVEYTTMTSDKSDSTDSRLKNPADDFRDETKGEVEGATSTPQGLIQPVEPNGADEGWGPTIQQDKAVCVKDSLSEALDSITMDGAEEIEAKPPVGRDPEPDYSKYSEEDGSHVPLKAPVIPTSMGGDEDKPDANGLVYVSATFTVDPDRYVSNNYRPSNMGKMPDAAALLKRKSGAMKPQTANPGEEAAISDLGTPEAKEAAASPDEPTEQQEKEAAKEADREQKKELDAEAEEERGRVIPTAKGEKPAADAALESVVLDYATFLDGSSFMCFDEINNIDYTKIAMDAGPKKPPTRENCQTTFAQCRAKNPLFCRFHGPKLLEADIKTAIKATVGPGCVVQVTKDKNSKNKFTFRLTVGCPPSKKQMVEKMVHMYLTQNPGISSSTEDWNLVGKHKQTTEFEMDILQADKPPKKNPLASQALADTKMAKTMHKKQAVVGETAPSLEKKAAKGEKWETVDEAVEKEWADLVDKNVHKSLLGNNGEFLQNFDEIANQFDEAHDKGDAAGLKKALEALKAEIGKYDEKGEKKVGSDNAMGVEEPEEDKKTDGVEGGGGEEADTGSGEDGKGGGGESKPVVLPSPNSAPGDKGAESSQPPQKDKVKQTTNGKADELASKLSNFKAQLEGMMEGGADAESVSSIKNLLSEAQVTHDKLAAQYEDIAVLDAQFAAIAETNDIFGKKLIEDAKRMAEGNANQLLAELESKVGGIEKTLANASTKGQDVKKGKIADEVEETIKTLGAYVFGGKRPPQGVDSVTDYLDYKKEEMESGGSSLSPDEMSTMEDTYHLKESYDATKAASNAMDAAVSEFKGLMDGEPGQGEGYESYLEKVEEAQKKVKAASVELMTNFDAYKHALEKCQYEVDAAIKLAASKKKLEGGGDEKPMSAMIHDAAVNHAKYLNFSPSAARYYEKQLIDVIHGGWDARDVKKPQQIFEGQTPLSVATQYFYMLKKSNAAPEVISALQGIIDLAEKKGGNGEGVQHSQQAQQKSSLTDEEKKAIIASMSPKQKLEAAVKIFKKKLAANPNDSEAKAKLAKYEAMLSKLAK